MIILAPDIEDAEEESKRPKFFPALRRYRQREGGESVTYGWA
jgi:hypothetical protein